LAFAALRDERHAEVFVMSAVRIRTFPIRRFADQERKSDRVVRRRNSVPGSAAVLVRPDFVEFRPQQQGDDMKTYLVALALTGALSGAAFAGDLMPAPAYKSPPPAVAATSWTGCSVNAGWGYGFWNQSQHTIAFPGAVATTSNDTTDGGRGWLGRFGGGCDYQFGGGLSNWVVGVFGDYDWMDLKGTNNVANVGFGGAFGAPNAAPEQEDNAWYAGARIGYLVAPALLSYFDAGYTQTRFGLQNFIATNTGLPSGGVITATTYNGWFVGGGLEYALNFSWLPVRGLFWRNEYRFASFGAKNLPLFGPGGGAFGEHTTPYVQTITSSLVWRFNLGGL
jgi:outer membrane immunogenic protein